VKGCWGEDDGAEGDMGRSERGARKKNAAGLERGGGRGRGGGGGVGCRKGGWRMGGGGREANRRCL